MAWLDIVRYTPNMSVFLGVLRVGLVMLWRPD
jgi:hypothetical protein